MVRSRVFLAALGLTLAFSAFFSWATGPDPMSKAAWITMIVLNILLLLACVYWMTKRSLTTRQPQFLPLSATFLIGSVLTACLLSIQFVASPNFGDLGMTRSRIRTDSLKATNLLRTYDGLLETFQSDANRYHLHQTGPAFMKPVWSHRYDFRFPDSYRLVHAASLREANRAWAISIPRDTQEILSQRDSAMRWSGGLNDLQQVSYATNCFRHLGAAGAINTFIAAILGAVHLCTWLVIRVRKRVQRRPLHTA